jgi:diguanylate cyclase (GGDEF)-like protein/PAS domain S-box-containing protein
MTAKGRGTMPTELDGARDVGEVARADTSCSTTVLAAVPRLSPSPVLIVDDNGTRAIDWANPACTRLLKMASADMVGIPLTALRARRLEDGELDQTHTDPLLDLLDRGGGRRELLVRAADGSSIYVRACAARINERGGASWILELHEIGAERRAGEELRASEDRFRALANHAPIGIFASEAGLRFAFLNERAAELLGLPLPDLLSTGWMDAIDERDIEAVVTGLSSVLEGSEIDLTVRVCAAEARWVRLRAVPTHLPGQGTGFIGSLEDITADKAYEATLAHQATHDALTGLPNRAYLQAEVEAVLGGHRQGDGSLALLFLDLDNFKVVNDSLGHSVGDELLVSVATRLKAILRGKDTLARFGGDEFVLLCPGVSVEAQAVAVAERMLSALSEPIPLANREFQITASLGVVLAEGGISDPASLLRDADIAMYEAKASGRARVAVFDTAAREALQQRLELMTDLRQAVSDRELEIVFQPVVDTVTGELCSAEALVRWTHPTHGVISAKDIIELAEENGCIAELGELVLRAACRQLAVWRATHPAPPATIAVNVSVHQLSDLAFVDLVEDALREAGLAHADLCLEFTEGVLMTAQGRGLIPDCLRHLRRRGVHIAIDDFGTGYSSMAYLKDMPANMLKIARDFVSGLGVDLRDTAIVEAVVRLGDVLGLTVVAEGVETDAQHEALAAMGCPRVQGYLVGAPQLPDEALPDPPHLTTRSAS